MQTADDRGNPGPDYQWGFGQVRIQQAVDLIMRRGLVQANVAQGETDLYTFVVTDTAVPAQVSLAWDDFEATFNANPALINNLNLELVAPERHAVAAVDSRSGESGQQRHARREQPRQ